MAVIWTSNRNWFISARAFREVLERTLLELSSTEDVAKLEVANDIKGLGLDLLPRPQAARIARAIDRAAAVIELELRSKAGATTSDVWLADALAELQFYMSEVPD